MGKIENLLGGMFFNQKTPYGAFVQRSQQKTLAWNPSPKMAKIVLYIISSKLMSSMAIL